jgi:hypothetical protein
MKYLSNNSGTLYYQRRFPLALVEAMGRKLFKMPLHLKPDASDRATGWWCGIEPTTTMEV